MDDQEKDQRQFLKQKIKMLQQQIVERTRNFMQSSRMKNKKSIKPNLQQKYIQTTEQSFQKNQQIIIKNEQRSNLYNQIQQFLDGFFIQIERKQQNKQSQKNTKNIQKNIQDKKQQSKDVSSRRLQSINFFKQNNQSVKQFLSKILVINDQKLNSEQLQKILVKFKQETISNYNILFSIFQQFYSSNQPSSSEFQKLKQKYEKLKNQIKQLQVRCQFITKALNQSQETNYQLRLQIQQTQTKLRNYQQKISQNYKVVEKYESTSQQLKIKIQQLQVMKKQYLKAYSKIKQQKQQLYFRNLDLQQIVQYLKNDVTVNKLIQNQEEIQNNRLKTIVQHSEDQIMMEQLLRKTRSQHSLAAIRQIIQYGLLQTNRSTSQKWIKQALIKLQQYQNTQQQQKQKIISSHTINENNINGIHQKYKILFGDIKKTMINKKQEMQDQFNKSLDKIIMYYTSQLKQKQLEQQSQKLPPPRKLSRIFMSQRQSININSSGDLIEPKQKVQVIQQKRKEPQHQSSQIYQLMTKLNQSHQRYTDLKKKYDAIIQKQDNFGEGSRVIVDSTKSQIDFKNFMKKLLNYEVQLPKNQKFTQYFFDKLSQRVFETLCNLPTGQHGQVFFMPTTQQQLQDAVQVIYKFSLQYDKFQQNRLKQFKSQALSLTKVLQQIAIVNEVPTQRIIESIHNNLDEQKCLSGNYVKSLIKKLSQERSERKSKSMDHIPKQGFSYQIQNSTKSEN